MRKLYAPLLLLLVPAAGHADEIDGLDSRAVEISTDFSAGASATSGNYGAAFVARDETGRPLAIRIQLRPMGGGTPSCSVSVPLPPGAVRVSHPVVAASGWLFVSATDSRDGAGGWKLYGLRRGGGLFDPIIQHCQGWTNAWEDLEAPPRGIASAPDAVVARGYTFVFVTDGTRQIHYLFLREQVFPPLSERSGWRIFGATRRAGREAWSKPAAAVYSVDPRPGRQPTDIHVFWLNAARTVVHHNHSTVWTEGYLIEGEATFRAFGDHIGATTAATACSATPDVRRPNPLFVVCGNSRGTYSIAHFRDPMQRWGAATAVERVNGRDWVSRSTYGGTSAPSLHGSPTFFVTFGSAYCPDRPGRPTLPGGTCFSANRKWVIERRWGVGATPLTGWNPSSAYTRGGPLE